MTEKIKNKNALKAPTPTYTKIDSSLNSTYAPPVQPRTSNIVVSQADLSPRQSVTQTRQPIQVKGALVAKPVEPIKDLTDARTATQAIYGIRDEMDNVQKKEFFDKSGFLMNKVSADAPLSALPQKEELPGRNIPVVGALLRAGDWLSDVTLPVAQGAAAVQGVPLAPSESIENRPLNGTIDKILYGAGVIGGGAINPSALEQSLITQPYKAAGAIVGSKLGQKALTNAGALANRGLANVGIQLSPKLINRGATEALAGVGSGTAYSLLSGQSDVDEILRNATLGGVGGVAFGAVGDAIGRLLRRNGVADDQVQEILALPMGRADAARLRNQVNTPDVITPEYTFGLPSPRVAEPTKARIERRVNPYRDKFETLMNRAMEREKTGGFTPGREDLEVQQMWADMADPTDPNLDELINLAYPRQRQVSPNAVQNARANQKLRRAAGGDLPVRSINERYPQGVSGNVDSPITVPARSPRNSNVAPIVENKGALTASANRSVSSGERGLYSNVEQSDISPEMRQGLASSTKREYTPITNEETVAKANKRIEEQGLDEAKAYVLNSGKATPEKVATGFRLLQEYQRAGRINEAVEVVDTLAAELTKAGQTVQAASIISRLSPEGQLLRLQRRISAINEGRPAESQIKLNEKTAQDFTDAAQSAQAARLSQERAGDVLNLTSKMLRGEELTAEERNVLSAFADDLQTFIKPEPMVKPDTVAKINVPRKRDAISAALSQKADEARARLAAKRNTLSANPLDQWADYSIIAADTLLKGAIKFSDFSSSMISEIGDHIRPQLGKLFEAGQRAIGRESRTISPVRAQSAEQSIQKEIRSTQAGKVADTYINKNAANMKKEDIENIRELALKVSRLEGENRANAEIEIQKILNEYEKSSIWDKVQAVRYIAMLLNTGTQAVNALSGPMMATTGYIADLFGAMIDAGISATVKRPRTLELYAPSPIQFITNWVQGAKIGGRAGWQGVNPAGIAGPNDIRGLTFKGKNPLSWLERSLGAVAKGADYGTYNAIQQSEMRRMGRLDARNKGIRGREEIKRHVENFVANPTPEALDQADKIARNTTFQRSDTLGGKTANFLNSSPGPIKPITGAIFPFVRTPVNIASTAVTLTPAGIIKGLYQLTSKSEATQREAIRTLGLGLTGTGLLSTAGWELSKLGIITGANDSGNKDVDAIRDQAGRGKYRFNQTGLMRFLTALTNGEGYEAAARAAKYKKGDHQFDYNKLQPLAFPLAIGAGLENRSGEGPAQQLAGAGADAFGSLYGMSTLKGVQDVFQPSYGGTLGEKALGVPSRIIESFAKSFSPSLIAQEARREDQTQRKTSYNDGIINDVRDYYMSRTPGLSKQLPPNLTTLGQERRNMPGVAGAYANPYRSDVAPYTEAAKIISDLIDRTGDETLAPSAPDKKVRGKDRTTGAQVTKEIPAKRYAQLQQEIGSEVVQKIEAIPSGWDYARKAARVQKIYDEVNTKYRNRIKRELGIRVSR